MMVSARWNAVSTAAPCYCFGYTTIIRREHVFVVVGLYRLLLLHCNRLCQKWRLFFSYSSRCEVGIGSMSCGRCHIKVVDRSSSDVCSSALSQVLDDVLQSVRSVDNGLTGSADWYVLLILLLLRCCSSLFRSDHYQSTHQAFLSSRRQRCHGVSFTVCTRIRLWILWRAIFWAFRRWASMKTVFCSGHLTASSTSSGLSLSGRPQRIPLRWFHSGSKAWDVVLGVHGTIKFYRT